MLEQYRGRVAALVLTHGHEDHIGAVAARAAARRRPGLRHAAHAGAGRAEARGARHRRRATGSSPVAPARARRRSARSRSSSSASRTACPTAWRWPSTRRSASIVHTGDFKIDQTPIDGAALRPASLRRARRAGRAGAASPTARTSIAAASPARSATSSTRSRRSSRSAPGKIVVAAFASSIYRMQILVDLADAVRSQGGVRRPRHACRTRRSPQRLGYLRIPPGVQIRDTRRARLSRRRTCCACAPGSQGEPHGGALAHRHRRSPPREARARTTRSSSRRARFPATRRPSAG